MPHVEPDGPSHLISEIYNNDIIPPSPKISHIQASVLRQLSCILNPTR